MKNVNKHLIFILLATLLFGAVLTACGGEDPTPTPRPSNDDDDGDPPPVEDPTDEPEPTAAPTEEPTEEPTPDPTAGFINFSNDMLGVSLSYPGDWAIEFDDAGGELKLASNQSILEDSDDNIEGAILNVLFLDTALFSELDAEVDLTDPVQLLGVFVDFFAQPSDEGISVTVTQEPTAVTINGQSAAEVLVDAVDEEGDAAVMKVLVIMFEDRAAVVLAGSEVSEEAQNRPLLDAIENSIILSTPVGVPEIETACTDIPVSAGFLLYGDSVAGTVDASGPSAWDFVGLDGELIDIIIEPTEDLDIVFDVVDADGCTILPDGEIDNSFETEEVRELRIPASGAYVILVRGFADATGDYQLTIGEAGTVTTTSPAGGESIANGVFVSGEVNSANPLSSYSFSGAEGDAVGVVVIPLGDFDAVVDMVDSAGNSLLSSERDASFGRENLLVTLPADDVYTVYVHGFEDAPGSFEMHISVLTNVVIAFEDTLEVEDEGIGHSFPFSTLNADSLVAIIVEPADELDVAIQVRQGDLALEGMGFDGETGYDTSFGLEEFVMLAEGAGDFMFQVLNSQDEELGNTGAYAVSLFGTPDIIFELAYGDLVDARTGSDGEISYYLNGAAGSSMVVNVASDDDSVDMVIEVLDLDGNVLASIDDGFSGEPEELIYTFESDGLVIIKVHDFYGSEGDFVMSVEAQ